MLHLSDRHCLVLLPFLHGSWLCPLFRRWLSSVLTAHVLCRQLVGLLHKSHLLVHRGSLAPLAFQFRLQRCDALQQFVHLRIVVFRLVVEVSERGVQVTVGGCGGLDGLRRGWLCPFFLAARIGEVEVHSVLRSRYLAVEHVAQLPDGTVAALLTLFHLPMLVGFQLVADNLPVRLVRVGHLGVVSVRSRRLLLAGGRGEYQPHRPDEHQHHSGQHDHLLPFQPLRLCQRFALLFRFPRFGSSFVLFRRFILCLFHINKVLSDCLFPPGSAVPPVRRVPFPYVSRRSCRCHRRLCRRCKGQAPRRRRTSPARCGGVFPAASRPDTL